MYHSLRMRVIFSGPGGLYYKFVNMASKGKGPGPGIDGPGAYYRALIGETFAGTYTGIYNRSDNTSKIWFKIKIDAMTPTMANRLREIKSKYDNKIWKGFHNGIIYINSEDYNRQSIQTAKKFLIQNYQYFPYNNRKEPAKYSLGGYCFCLKCGVCQFSFVGM